MVEGTSGEDQVEWSFSNRELVAILYVKVEGVFRSSRASEAFHCCGHSIRRNIESSDESDLSCVIDLNFMRSIPRAETEEF